MGVLLVQLLLPAETKATQHRPVCGVNFAHSWHSGGMKGYGSSSAQRSLLHVREYGIEAVALTPFAYLKGIHGATVHYRPHQQGSETWAATSAQAHTAHALGLAVFLKPHIWVHGGAFRGAIDPAVAEGGWNQFKRSYEKFMLKQAELAEAIDAQWLAVGVELASLVRHDPGYMGSLANKIRQRYAGKLTYCANWDTLEKLPKSLWEHVDAVGVQMFAPLSSPTSERANPKSMQAQAEHWLNRYRVVGRQANKPLLVCEVGFMNRVGGSAKPWVWPERLASIQSTPEGLKEQENAYEAVLKTFGGAPDVVAIFWWKWFSDMDSGEEGTVGFVPYGKPAGQRLRAYCLGRTQNP